MRGGDAALPYDSEVPDILRSGFKSTPGDGTTRINGNVFYYDYSDYQAFLFVGVGGVVINRDADNVGALTEIQSSPAPGLRLVLDRRLLRRDG